MLGCFSASVDNIPVSITRLTLGESFNETIDRLPPNLTHLDLITSVIFDRPIDHLPDNLTHLQLGPRFNQTLDNLPGSLIYLVLAIGSFDQGGVIAKLPENLQLLEFAYVDGEIPSIKITNLGMHPI